MDPSTSFADAVARARQVAAKINKPVVDETQDDRAIETKRSKKWRGKKGKYREAFGRDEQCYTSLQPNVSDRYSSRYEHRYNDGPLSLGQAEKRSYQQQEFFPSAYGMVQSYDDENRTEEYTIEARGYPVLDKPRNIEPATAATQTAATMNQQLGVSEPNSRMMHQQNDKMNFSMDITEEIRQASGGKKERYRQAVDDRTGGAECYNSPRDVLRSGLSVQRNKNGPQSASQAAERYEQEILSLVACLGLQSIDENLIEECTISDEIDACYAGVYPGHYQSRNIDKEADQTATRLYQQMRFSSPDDCIMQPYNDKNRKEEYSTQDGMSEDAGGYRGLDQLRNTEVAVAAAEAAARINQQLGVSKPNSGMMQQQNDQMNISMVINEVNNQASGDSKQNDLQYASDVVKDIICTPCGDDGSKEAVSKYCTICQEYLCLTCARCHQRMKATRDHFLAELQPEEHSSAMVIEKCFYHPDRNIEMYCRTHDMVYCTRCIATEHRSCTGVTDVENAAEDENCTISELQKLQDEMKVIFDQLEMCNKKKESVVVATEDQCSNIASKIREVKREMTNHIEKMEREAMDALKKTKAEIRNELETDMSNVNKMIGAVEERSKKMERAAHMDNVQKFVQVKLSQEVAKDARKLHEENKAKREKAISCTENEQISKSFMKMQFTCKISTFEQ